jgi:hypothetical protein
VHHVGFTILNDNNIPHRILRVTDFFSLSGYLCVVTPLYCQRYSLVCVAMTSSVVTVRRTDWLNVLCDCSPFFVYCKDRFTWQNFWRFVKFVTNIIATVGLRLLQFNILPSAVQTRWSRKLPKHKRYQRESPLVLCDNTVYKNLKVVFPSVNQLLVKYSFQCT